jgi:hypothetical protein
MPHHQLIVVERDQSLTATKNSKQYSTCGFVDQEQLKHYLQNARA